MIPLAPRLTLWLLVAASPVAAGYITERCATEQQAAGAALQAEIEAACDCAGSTDHQSYVRCAKGLVRTAQREGRVSKACGRAVGMK